MTLTIDNILDEIIAEVGGDTTDSAFKTLMLGFMKTGIRHIPALIRSRLFITIQTKTLAALAYSIDLSSLDPGFIKERAVWWVTTENKRQAINLANSHSQFNDIFNQNANGTPRVYRVYDKTMEFDRSANQQYTIGIEYFKEVSAISTSNTFFGDDSLLAAVKHYTKMVYYGDYEEDEVKQNRHERQGGKIIFELEGDFEAQEMGGYVEQTSNYFNKGGYR